MPSIVCPAVSLAITAATNKGLVSVSSTTDIYPGATAQMGLTNGTASILVKVLKVISSTQILVRRWPTKKAQNTGTTAWDKVDHDQQDFGAPNYGVSDVSAYNANARISIARQAVPVDPAHSKRLLP